MKYLKWILAAILVVALAVGFYIDGCWVVIRRGDGGFARTVAEYEQAKRLEMVSTAKKWLGTQEGDADHEQIITIYNAHEPLARGYPVTLTDNWCAAYASSIAIQCGMTDIIPTECGCERQIGLWQNIGRWEEDDNYLPLPGDYIYYAWDDEREWGDCTGWADHVGIVVGTSGPFIKVIEGNKHYQVMYRYILRGYHQIRGYGLPNYEGIG